MTWTPEEFRTYIKRHHIAGKTVAEAYIAENPKEQYEYADVDAVYQRQVEAQIGAHTIGRARQGRVECLDGSGARRTMNGMKYGHSYQ